MNANAESIAGLLVELGTTARVLDGALQASHGVGPRARKASIPIARIDAAADPPSFARGVYAVVAEPNPLRREELSFEEAAARIAATLEGPSFAQGVDAAGGAAPFLTDFADGISVAYVVELDNGFRLVSDAQIATWGIHPERAEKAALSILYHRTAYETPRRIDDLGLAVDLLSVGDGYDAARALVLDIVDYPRSRKGMLFAVPTPDLVLFCDTENDAKRDAFRAFARRHFDAASFPLSPSVFAIVDGKRQRAPLV